jgi:hypothetical protein
LQRLNLEVPFDSYFKGEKFNGHLFCKFSSKQAASAVLNAFNKQRRMFKGQSIKCKPDLPLEPRVCLSFLLGLRYQLIKWDCATKADVKVNEEILTMTVAGTPIVSAAVKDNALSLSWLEKSWSEWGELQGSPEVAALIELATKKLKDAAGRKPVKGASKGKGPVAQ